MTYLEFMKLKENEALENNKEDSAVVLLLEHLTSPFVLYKLFP